MTRYSNYNNSETKWIGSIPDNWGISRLDREAYIRARLGWRGLKADEYVSSGYGFLATPNIKGRDIDFTNINFISAERYFESPEIILDVGDVLLTKDGSTIGTTNIVRHLPFPCTVNGSIAVLTPTNGILPLYLYYYLTSPKAQDRFWYLQDGQGVPHLFQRDLRKIEIIKPPLEEQLAIVRHLENKTAEIDGLVERLWREVELLEQYRRELIARTVTRGLDPDVPMRDSGIEWIGAIPAAWSLQSLKTMLWRTNIKNKPERRVLSVERAKGVVDRETEGSPDNHNRLPEDLSGYLAVNSGQFVMNKMKAWRGSCGVSTLDGIVSPAYYVFDLEFVEPKFFNWAIRSAAYVPFFGRDSYGIRTDQWDFKVSALRSIPFFSPSRKEQKAIASYLERETSVIDSTVTGIYQQIELLAQYRKQVINDAVTGKIRVGKVA